MADTKITALSALTAADPANDVLPIVDVNDPFMAASGTTKKISINNILGASGTATLASATISGDLTVDTNTLKVDSANNRVGVGTASPIDVFQISSQNPNIYLTDSGIAGSDQVNLYFGPNTIPTYSGILVDISNDNFNIRHNSSTRLSIGSTGIFTWQNVGGVVGPVMTLNSTGLGVGASPTTKLDVLGSGDGELRLRAGSDAALIFSETAANKNWKLKPSGGDFQFQYSATAYNSGYSPLMYLTATGNLGIGVSPGYKLDVNGVARVSSGGDGVFLSSASSPDLYVVGVNYYNNNGTEGVQVSARPSWRIEHKNSSDALAYLDIGFRAASAAASAFTSRFKIDGSGNVVSNVTGTAPTLATNSQMVFNLTSNTNLRISVRGTDGTTRTANITLA